MSMVGSHTKNLRSLNSVKLLKKLPLFDILSLNEHYIRIEISDKADIRTRVCGVLWKTKGERYGRKARQWGRVFMAWCR